MSINRTMVPVKEETQISSLKPNSLPIILLGKGMPYVLGLKQKMCVREAVEEGFQ